MGFELIIFIGICWFILGYSIIMKGFADGIGSITISDLFFGLIGGIMGPFSLVFYVLLVGSDKVIWRKK